MHEHLRYVYKRYYTYEQNIYFYTGRYNAYSRNAAKALNFKRRQTIHTIFRNTSSPVVRLNPAMLSAVVDWANRSLNQTTVEENKLLEECIRTYARTQ